MTFGLTALYFAPGCTKNRTTPCGVPGTEPYQKVMNCWILSTIAFDILAMITMITLGSLALKGRIHLPTRAGIGLLGGAGGVLLLPLLVISINCCQESCGARQNHSAHSPEAAKPRQPQ